MRLGTRLVCKRPNLRLIEGGRQDAGPIRRKRSPQVYEVRKQGDFWTVQNSQCNLSSRLFARRRQAETLGKVLAARARGRLVIYRRDGTAARALDFQLPKGAA